MAWVFPDKRDCPTPSCPSDRTIVIQCRDGFRLSCSRCAVVSDALPAIDAFFRVWGGDKIGYKVGHLLELDGVGHWNRKKYVENVPIRVLLSSETALPMERKDAA